MKSKSAPCIAPLRGAVEGDAAPAALRLRDGLPELGDVPHGDVVGVAKCRGPSHSEIGRTLSPTSHIPHPRFIVSILCKETEEGTRKMGLVVSHSFKYSKMKEEKAAASVTRGGSASARMGVGALVGGQTGVDALCITSNTHTSGWIKE